MPPWPGRRGATPASTSPSNPRPPGRPSGARDLDGSPDEAEDPAAGGFRLLEERVVHRGRAIEVVVGTFAGPGGATFERDIVHHPGAVSVVALDDTDQAVLVRQYRAALDAWLLELPAGKLDVAGEDPMACAQRELGEEVGLVADDWELLLEFHNSPGFSDELSRVYLARGLSEVEHDRQSVEEQAMTISRLALGGAVARIAAGEIRDAKTCIGLLMARERLGRR